MRDILHALLYSITKITILILWFVISRWDRVKPGQAGHSVLPDHVAIKEVKTNVSIA